MKINNSSVLRANPTALARVLATLASLGRAFQ
jgi:hypothetical protein